MHVGGKMEEGDSSWVHDGDHYLVDADHFGILWRHDGFGLNPGIA